MTFSTATFFLYLPLVFTLYWVQKGKTGQNSVIVVASYVFYGWWDYRFCALILASSLIDYAVGLLMGSCPQDHLKRRLLLLVSLAANLGLLGFFKYYGFFAENLQSLLHSVGVSVHLASLNIILPVGISFYTFQTLSYSIDIYRGKISATRQLVPYLAYVSFFPQLVAGPIERAQQLLPQFLVKRQFDAGTAREGCRLILWGLFKKVVIADNLALVVEASYGDPGASSGVSLAFATVAFAFQIYCDFSGYSDIAIGTAKLFAINLMRNFAFPYFSLSVPEFWRRWHISLSTWFRDYLFIPLGGSRCSLRETSRNLLITFVVSGCWHGASWNFVVWGALHGLAMVVAVSVNRGDRSKRGVADTPGGDRLIPGVRVMSQMFVVFVFVNLTWVVFRAETLAEASVIVQKILGGVLVVGQHDALWREITGTPETLWTVIHLFGFLMIEWTCRAKPYPFFEFSWPRALRWGVYTAFIADILYFGALGQNPFIYFQF